MSIPYEHERDIGRAIGLLQEWVQHGPAEATQRLLQEQHEDDFAWDNTVLAMVRVAATIADNYAEEHELDAEDALELAAIELDVSVTKSSV